MKRPSVAVFPQFLHIRFGEILVSVADVLRSVDVGNGEFAVHGSEGIGSQIVEGAGGAGTEVVQTAAPLRLVEKVEYIDHVFDVDKIAPLFSVGDALAVRAEQFHASGFFDLPDGVKDDRRHTPLVVFVGAVNIKKLESGPEGRGGFLL